MRTIRLQIAATEAPPACAARHTRAPSGYVAWHEWADKMQKTHYQVLCEGCGKYEIWKLKTKCIAAEEEGK